MPEHPSHREVAEQPAAYAVGGLAALRQRLENFDGWLTPERHRVVELEEDGKLVLCLQLWVRDYSDIAARWEARDAGEPHPPTRYMWLKFKSYPKDADWIEHAIEEALDDLRTGAREIKDSEPFGWSPDPPPPGYEDDYDVEDWLMDLRYGFTWQRHLPSTSPSSA